MLLAMRRVVETLHHVQEDGPWQATLRAICAIEAVIQTGHTDVCGKIAVAFQVCSCANQASMPV